MIETGLPIMRRTACRVGAHAFVWTGTWYADPERPPDPTMRCDCGAKLAEAEAVVSSHKAWAGKMLNAAVTAEERVRALEAALRKEIVIAIYNGDDSGTGQWGWYCKCGGRWEVDAPEAHKPRCTLAKAATTPSEGGKG